MLISAESDLRSGSFCVIDERGNDNTPEHVSDDVPLLSFSGDNGRGDDRGVPERHPAATNFLTMVADDVKLNGGGRHSGKINFQKCSDPLLAATETWRCNVLRRPYGALCFFDDGGGCSMSSDDSEDPNKGGRRFEKKNQFSKSSKPAFKYDEFNGEVHFRKSISG